MVARAELSIENIANFMEFEKNLVREYLRCASVDAMSKKGTSFASIHRLLNQWGIVKQPSRVPMSSLSALAEYFRLIAITPGGSIENVQGHFLRHNAYTDAKLSLSLSSLYRVQKNVLEGISRGTATVLMVVLSEDPTQVLIGEDTSFFRNENDTPLHPMTIPGVMTYGKETRASSLLRVLQQEVFTDIAVEGQLSKDSILAQELVTCIHNPFATLRILDIGADMYVLPLPKHLADMVGGGRLEHMRFVDTKQITSMNPLSSNYRPGIVEMVMMYEDVFHQGFHVPDKPYEVTSVLNRAIHMKKKRGTVWPTINM